MYLKLSTYLRTYAPIFKNHHFEYLHKINSESNFEVLQLGSFIHLYLKFNLLYSTKFYVPQRHFFIIYVINIATYIFRVYLHPKFYIIHLIRIGKGNIKQFKQFLEIRFLNISCGNGRF